jgi:hypothetical protein
MCMRNTSSICTSSDTTQLMLLHISSYNLVITVVKGIRALALYSRCNAVVAALVHDSKVEAGRTVP